MKRKFKNIPRKNLIISLIFVGIICILSAVLMNSFSLPNQQVMSFQSEKLNYDNKEAGSFEVTKNAKWISKGKARISIDIDTVSKIENREKDIILVLDDTFGENKENVKSKLTDFITQVFMNEENKMALITFGETSLIETNLTNDKQMLINKIESLRKSTDKRNYYKALINLDNLLKEYTISENRDLVILFVMNGYPDIGLDSQEKFYMYLKEQYPYIDINVILSGVEVDTSKAIEKISDYQYMTSISNLNNQLLSISNFTKKYEKFILSNEINNSYFDMDSISKIKLTEGNIKVEDHKIIWNLNGLHTGTVANLTVDISIKEGIENDELQIPIQTTTQVEYSFENVEETIVGKNGVGGLPPSYKIIYEGNQPEDCKLENMPKDEFKQVYEIVEIDSKPTCKGYQFEGWKRKTDNVTDLTNKQFIMPESDVILTAEWSKITIVKSMDGIVMPGLPKEPVINAAKVGYPIITEFGVELQTEISIEFEERDDLENLYSIDDGKTWIPYTGPFNKISSRTIRAKSVLKDTEDYIESSKIIEMPEDALGPLAYDGDEETSEAIASSNAIGSKIYVSKNMSGQYIKMVSQNWYNSANERYATFYIEQYNKSGELIETTTFSNANKTTNTFIAKENCDYLYIYTSAPAQGSEWRSPLFEILPLTMPVITEESNKFPVLTDYGIEAAYTEVSIQYFYTSVQRLYRINGGEWQEYQDKNIRLKIHDVIETRGIDIDGNETPSSNYTAEIEGALWPETYDEDLDTYDGYSGSSKKMYIDKSLYNKEIRIVAFVESGYWPYDQTTIALYDDEDNVLVTTTFNNTTNNYSLYDKKWIVPENTSYIKITATGNEVKVYEITPGNVPILTENIIYPRLTEFGMEASYTEITIDYFSTSVERLYRINGGEWQEYQDKSVRLEVGDKIEAKGVDQNHHQTFLSNYTATLPTDALKPLSYDDDILTYDSYSGTNKKIWIDSALQNQKLRLVADLPSGYWPYDQTNVYFYDKESTLLKTVNCSYGHEYSGDALLEIPENTFYMQITATNNETKIYEITPANVPVIETVGEIEYPSLTKNGVSVGVNNVSINYYKTSVKRLYRINDGEWIDYQDMPIRLELDDKIESKGIDKNGKETFSSVHTFKLNDAMSKSAYDSDDETYFQNTVNQNGVNYYFTVEEDAFNKEYIIKKFNLLNSYYEFKLYSISDSGESSITPVNKDGDLIFKIPENSKRIRIWMQGNVALYEIALKTATFTSNINTNSLRTISKSKEVLIEYDSSCSTNYYQINNGEFKLYEGPITNLLPNDRVTAYCHIDSIDKDSRKISSLADVISMPITDAITVPITYNNWGEKLYYKFPKKESINLTLSFLNSDNNVISSYNYNHSYDNDNTTEEITENRNLADIIEIPGEAVNLKIEGENGIHDLGLVNTTEFELNTDLDLVAYDKDFDSYAIGTDKKIYFDSSDWGKYLYISVDFPRWTDAQFYFRDANGKSLGVYSIRNNRYSRIDVIPENASYFEIICTNGNNNYVNIYEAAIIDIKDIKETTYTKGPIITTSEVEMATVKDIDIKYLQGYINEYSLDLGNTWNEYAERIHLDKPTTVLARSVDTNGNVISSSSFKVSKINTDISGTELEGFAKKIYDDNTLIVQNPKLFDSSNNTEEKSGLYKSFKTNSGNATYYFRGNVENNYVSFVGQTWRIVRINEDGTVRLILQEGIHNQNYQFNIKNIDFNKMYYENSYITSPLKAWYMDNILEYEDAISSGKYFCEQAKVKGLREYTIGNAKMPLYTKYTPDFRCETDGNGYGFLNDKVGLITYDEVVFAGGYVDRNNSDYYLRNGQSFWTMSASGVENNQTARTWFVGGNGDIGSRAVSDLYYIRPVINIKTDVKVTGAGSSNNPYVIQVDNKEESPDVLTEKIKKQNSIVMMTPSFKDSSNNLTNPAGLYVTDNTNNQNLSYYFRGNVENNYVTFADKTWRIVRINEDGTVKLILQEPMNNQDYQFNYRTADFNKMYYTNSFIKTALNTWYTDNLLSYEDGIASGKNSCEQAKTRWADNTLTGESSMMTYTDYIPNLKCQTDGNGYGVLENKISTITYDEVLLAGGYPNKGNTTYYLRNGYNYWTMSPAGLSTDNNPHEWIVGGDGDLSAQQISNSYRIRPVINLKAGIIASGKGTINNPYVVEVETIEDETSGKLNEKIKKHNPVIQKEPSLTSSSNNTIDPTGLYSSTDTNDGSTTYYYRGNVENNYVTFADKTWRIVRINEDGTIRLILQEGIGNKDYRYNYRTNDFYRMYYTEGTIKTPLETWYLDNLLEYEERIASGNYFCEQAKTRWADNVLTSDASMTTYTSYTPTFKCERDGIGYGVVDNKIALLTYDEVVYAGGYGYKENSNYYLRNGQDFWTMSPAGLATDSNPHGWIVGSNGSPSAQQVTNGYRVRPVINLKEDTIVSGKGTKNNPYVVEVTRNNEETTVNLVERVKERNQVIRREAKLTDTSINAGDVGGLYESKETNSGNSTYYFRGNVLNNYVSFAGQKWRIVRINEDGTIRLILQEGIENKDYKFNSLTNDNYRLYYSNSFIKTPLETWYLDNLKPYESAIATGNYFCEQAKFTVDGYTIGEEIPTKYADYTPNFKCESDANGYGSINNRIGLITYDEAWLAGAYPGRADGEFYLRNGQNFWTMSPSGFAGDNNPRGWAVYWNGDSAGDPQVSNSYRVRPVINIKADTLVSSLGSGSINNPYIVQVERNEKQEKTKFSETITSRNKVKIQNAKLTDTNVNTGDVDGLYASTNTNDEKVRYYFRGKVENNYVSFANQNWRIVGINEDGTIRLVLQEGIENKDYQFNTLTNNSNKLYYSNSFIKTPLETWYFDHLTSYEDVITNGNYYCEQARTKAADNYTSGSANMITYSTYDPTFKCERDGNGYGIINNRVSMLTYDEIIYAGAYPGRGNSEYYLYNGQNYWTTSLSGIDTGNNSRVWYGVWNGDLSEGYVSNSYRVRPVINIKPDVLVTGSGSSTNPYIVHVEPKVKEEPANFVERIKSRNPVVKEQHTLVDTSVNKGEVGGLYSSTNTNSGKSTYYFRGKVENNYVLFAGQIWRIVRINEDGTVRLVLQEGIENKDYQFNIMTPNVNKMYYKNNLLGAPLKAWYDEHLLDYEEAIASGNYFCSQARTKGADNYTSGSASMTTYTSYSPSFKCEVDGNGHGLIDDKISLLTYDEVVYAGGYVGRGNEQYYLRNNQNFWTMSPSGIDTGNNSRVWSVGTGGSIGEGYVSNSYRVRPVINIKASVDATGVGSITNPYVLQVPKTEEIPNTLSEKVKNQNPLVTLTPSFKESSNNLTNPSGLYVTTETNSENTSYYFRGNVENNYVSFAGQTWRIVRINEDGTVRLVLQEGINNKNYQYNALTADVSKLYYKNSLIPSLLKAWYMDNLLEYEDKIVSGDNYCEQSRVKWADAFTSGNALMMTYTEYTPTYKCDHDANGYGILNSKIGLLTYDEVVMAGGYKGKNNTDYYLRNGHDFWTMSSSGIDSETWTDIWFVGGNGDINTNNVSASYQVRPVINLKAEVIATGKGTKNNPYVVEAERKEEEPGILTEKIKNQNPVIEQIPTLTDANSQISNPSGLYSSTDTNDGTSTYYFRGNVENNYVSFAGQTWRIIRINEDGTVRMILQDTINNQDYQFNYRTADFNKMYYRNSFIKTALNTWYTDYLLPYEEGIASGNYSCEQAKVRWADNVLTGDTSMTTYTSYTPTFKCESDGHGYGSVDDKISTITYDEIVFAGGYGYKGNTNTYLHNGYTFWTMSPAGLATDSNPHAWILGSDGVLSAQQTANSYRIRPVINLKSGIMASGKGTINNPYVVEVNVTEEEESGKLNEKIKNHNPVIEKEPTLTNSSNNTIDSTGLYSSINTNDGNATYYYRGNIENNYVSFADKTWRIVRINEDGTIRLVLQEGIEDKDYRYNYRTNDFYRMYYTEGFIKTPLETWYLDNLKPYEERIAFGNYFCEQARVRWADNVLTGDATMTTHTSYTPTFKCERDGIGYGIINNKISLLSYDEIVFAGGYPNKDNNNYYLRNGQNYWTMSPAGLATDSNPHDWIVGSSGSLSAQQVTNSYRVRPVINLKEDTIVSGKGTKNNPYIVEITKNDKEESVSLIDRIKERNKVIEKLPKLTDTSINVGDVGGLYESKETNSGNSTYYFRGNVENNYVTFAGQKWRIVRINEDETIRLVLQEGIENKDYRYNIRSLETQRLYYSNSFIKTPLETWYLDNLRPYESAIVTGDYFCEQAMVRRHDSHTAGSAELPMFNTYTPNFKCETDANGYGIVNNKIALLSYDEVWLAGGYPGRGDGEFYLRNGQNYWTMSPEGMDTSGVATWQVSWNGDSGSSYASDSYRVRPVINIKSDVKVTGSGSSKNPYVVQVERDDTDTPTNLTDRIKSRNPIVKQVPKLIDTSVNIGDLAGLYESKDTNSGSSTYYFRGDVKNNYVTFAGQIWRIVRINEDGTVRLIMQDGIEKGKNYQFNTLINDSNKLYYSNSFIKMPLETWYLDNLKPYETVIARGNYFCEQARTRWENNVTAGNSELITYTEYIPNFKCESDGNGYGNVSNKVGLITYDEALYAGGYVNKNNSDYYLRNGYSYWTMSPSGFDSSGNPHIWYVGGDGDIWATRVSSSIQIRPVINLKADVKVVGAGSSKNPYVVQFGYSQVENPVISNAGNAVTISYASSEYINQYSLDLGETWNSYKEPIIVTEETTIIARSVDVNANVVSSSSFKVTKLNNNEIPEVFESLVEIPSIAVSKVETGYKIDIIYPLGYGNQYSLDSGETWKEYTEPFIVTEEITILAQSIDNNGNVVSSNSFQITGEGSSEILEGESSKSLTATPNIQASDKAVEISYPDGYNNEYSLDLGETWITYTEPFTLDKPTMIFARSKNNNEKIVSSSSFKVTELNNNVSLNEMR